MTGKPLKNKAFTVESHLGKLFADKGYIGKDLFEWFSLMAYSSSRSSEGQHEEVR